jgi:hypothetical protein
LDEGFALVDHGGTAYKGDYLRDGVLDQLLEMFQAYRSPCGSVHLLEAVDRVSRQEPVVACQSALE